LTTIAKTDVAAARARAGRIRQGIHSYLTTLSEIAAAYNERDWVMLGYADWAAYVDEEFGADRLRLPPEHRQKAVAELRLAGMSTRAIGAAVGASKDTVQRDVAASGVSDETPDRVVGADGKSYASAAPDTGQAEDEPAEHATAGALEGTVEPRQEAVRWSPVEDQFRLRALAGETVVASLRGEHANLLRWAEENGLLVRIDRRTEWGNPFEIPGDGDRAEVISSYEQHYLPHKPSLLAKLGGLRGKVLVCWCSPEACHGDVLVAALEST